MAYVHSFADEASDSDTHLQLIAYLTVMLSRNRSVDIPE
jgi:hypothetical protein